MVIEAKSSSAETAEDVKIGRFGSERERGGSERGFAVESGASHVGAEKEMGDRLQISSVAEVKVCGQSGG